MQQSLLHQSLSTKPGIYLFLGKGNKILYIGKAKNLRNRVSSYFNNNSDLGVKTRILVSQIKGIKIIEVSSEIEALLLEANYIKKFKPKYNIKLMDGKAYPLIRITIKDKYPKVLTARKTDDNKSLYFGPFPNSSAVFLVLKTIRRIFPYQSVLNHAKRVCLYNHLGLCPCPEVLQDKEYKKNIRRIVLFLRGKTSKVLRDLEKERNSLSKLEEFEKAKALQMKINAINYVTSSDYKNFDYIVNPNLDLDIRNKELNSLKTSLLKHGVQIEGLNRIECFDISNTSGTNATGSMVVFTNGEKDKSQYRKFKIKFVKNAPDDFAMMKEVIRRRLNHPEWPLPDLIIVDGGKGQVSAALNAIAAMKQFSKETIDSPVIGLAKKEEAIITPIYRHSEFISESQAKTRSRNKFGMTTEQVQLNIDGFIEVFLPKESPALHLVQRIRDEAHRFAITYHRKLRSRSFFQNR